MHMQTADTKPAGVFFIHIMKTGGTSLNNALNELFEPAARYPADDIRLAVGQKVDIRFLQQRYSEPGCAIAFASVHMPAWVAEQVAPDHLSMTILREPVSRTLSHLRQEARTGTLSDDIEEVYEHPLFRARLANYQTRLFSMTEAHQVEAEAARREFDRQIAEGSADAHEELMLRFRVFLATAVSSEDDLSERDLREAIARLERVDEVGTTDQLDDLARRVESRLGAALPRIGRANVTDENLHVSGSLLERIRADNALDFELYEHACRLARANGRSS
jgi:hypothetical protein